MNSSLKKFIKHEVQILLKEDKRSELRTAYKREVFDNTNYKGVDYKTIKTALMHLFRFDGGPNDETRQMCIDAGPWWALQYAQIEGPHDDTRAAVVKSGDSSAIYRYARYVDKGPRDDTRNAVLKFSLSSYDYARYVDKGPRDDTRNAVLRDPYLAFGYAKNIDKTPRSDTRKAAWENDHWGRDYDRYFNITEHPPV